MVWLRYQGWCGVPAARTYVTSVSSDSILTEDVEAVGAMVRPTALRMWRGDASAHVAVVQVRAQTATLSDSDLSMLKEAFELFDTDKSGSIDAAELKFCMQALEFTPTDKEIAGMMKEIDSDGNSTIEYQEFVDLMAAKMVPLSDGRGCSVCAAGVQGP